MEVWKLCAVVLLLSPTFRAQDTVEEDSSAHQLESLVMLLTLTECEELVEALSTPDDDIFKRLERLAPENNQLNLQPLSKRSLLSDQGSEEKCRKALTDWLLENGEEMYYDRLTRSLQHIGRTDVALEMTKKFNEDKLLSLTRYVEDYHKTVSSFNVPEEPTEAKKKVKVRNLSSKNLDLILTRAPVPPYMCRPVGEVPGWDSLVTDVLEPKRFPVSP
uniref:Uncharacterized protein n=1 Tax=Knipowitschia caucasica TaxID=637954 RepID=A0AAV2LZB9_KNICA